MLKFKKKSKWATSFYKTIQWSGFKNKTMTRGTQAAAVSVIEEKKTPQFEWKCLLWGFSGLKRSVTERLPEREAELNYFTGMRPGCKETFRIVSSVVQFFCTCAENSNKLVYLPILVIASTNFNPSIEPIY